MLSAYLYSEPTTTLHINFTFNALTSNFGVGGGILISLLFFMCGLFCLVYVSSNLLSSLIFAELMFVGMFVGFLTASTFLGDSSGLNYGLYLLCAAAVDSAIGLVLTLNTYRLYRSVIFSRLTTLRG